MKDIVSVYATFGGEDEARNIARTVVDERLAACANLLGTIGSIYRWEGRIEETQETAAIFKTARARSRMLVDRICAVHSYVMPAVVTTKWKVP